MNRKNKNNHGLKKDTLVIELDPPKIHGRAIKTESKYPSYYIRYYWQTKKEAKDKAYKYSGYRSMSTAFSRAVMYLDPPGWAQVYEMGTNKYVGEVYLK